MQLFDYLQKRQIHDYYYIHFQNHHIENFSWFGKIESEVILGPNVFCFVAQGLYTDPAGLEMIDLMQLQEEGATFELKKKECESSL
jgi:hypothetical protein